MYHHRQTFRKFAREFFSTEFNGLIISDQLPKYYKILSRGEFNLMEPHFPRAVTESPASQIERVSREKEEKRKGERKRKDDDERVEPLSCSSHSRSFSFSLYFYRFTTLATLREETVASPRVYLAERSDDRL